MNHKPIEEIRVSQPKQDKIKIRLSHKQDSNDR